MKKFLLLIGFLLIIGIAGQASAITIQNASFEDSLSEWDSSGSSASTASSIVFANGVVSYPYVPTHSGSFAQLKGNDTSIYQALSWSTGDTISFDWNFLKVDSEDTDYGFFGVLDSSLTSITEITTISAVGSDSTGWKSFSYEFDLTPGDAIIFGVVSSEASTSFSAPILLVDNITTTMVPESATLFLLAFGLLSIAGVRRKL